MYVLVIPGSTHVAALCLQPRRLIRLCPQQVRRRDPETGMVALYHVILYQVILFFI